MPRIHDLLASLALLTSIATSAPFFVQETCFCEPSHPDLATHYHNETLAACEQIAMKTQLSRAAERRLPQAPKSWINERGRFSLSEHKPTTPKLNDNIAPYTIANARAKGAFEAAVESISGVLAARAQHQHSAQTLPPRRNPRAPSVREQELKRRGQQSEEYKIICRGVVFRSSETKEEQSERFTYISSRPVPLLFIFLSMLLACMTIVEWGLDMWATRLARIQLDGAERAMCADVLPSSQELPMERYGTVDVEKRAEAQHSS